MFQGFIHLTVLICGMIDLQASSKVNEVGNMRYFPDPYDCDFYVAFLICTRCLCRSWAFGYVDDVENSG